MADRTSGRPAALLFWLVALAGFGGVAGLVNGWFSSPSVEIDLYDAAVSVAAVAMLALPLLAVVNVTALAVRLGLAVCYVPRAVDAWRDERQAWLDYYAALDQVEAAERDNAASAARGEADGKAWAARRKTLLAELKELGKDGDEAVAAACRRELEAGEAAWGEAALAAARAAGRALVARLQLHAAALGKEAGATSDTRIWYDRRTFGDLAYAMAAVGPKPAPPAPPKGGSRG